MTINFEGCFWIAVGLYFLLVGMGRLPVTRHIAEWFGEAGSEGYRKGLRVVIGPAFIGVGALLLLRFL